MARSRTGQILPEGSRVYVEEHLFRADVEERLFRAASACAFNCGLQPRPALKGIHPPAVAAMNGRSSTLMQALVLRARRSIQTEGSPGAAQVRGNHPCVSNTWRNKEMGQPQSVPAPEKMGQPAEGCEHWIAQVAGQGLCRVA